jgi:predicted N-acyltransferase
MVAAVTLDSQRMCRLADDGPTSPWTVTAFESAVVDCRQGLAQVEAERWTNNRRNERNRGLKRGCTLHAEHDPAALAAWYPLYLAGAMRWDQAPVPLGFLQDLLRSAPDQTVFNCVRLAGELVAGHFCFVSRDRLVAWQGAVRTELASTHFLTTLLYWQDVVHACGQGLAAVDFGGCVGRDGLWDFKRRCGAEPEPRWQLLARSGPGRWLQRLTAGVRARGGGAA